MLTVHVALEIRLDTDAVSFKKTWGADSVSFEGASAAGVAIGIMSKTVNIAMAEIVAVDDKVVSGKASSAGEPDEPASVGRASPLSPGEPDGEPSTEDKDCNLFDKAVE